MHLDLGSALSTWLSSPDVQGALTKVIRAAIREEIRAVLEDELLDVSQAAELMKLTPGALRKQVERGNLPCIRLGRRLRFRRAELLRLATLRSDLA